MGLNSRRVPSAAYYEVAGSQSWNRNRIACCGSLVGSTPSQSQCSIASSRWAWMS
jgi:hypothetical protein